ncbi:MAG TPA: choice-of-anchor D domain-containing protein [Acidobacteriaceae bacterium]|nr:choice-of-anchor D domain-containing protein [Acidobacteriaceae bacterium]
MTFRTEIAFVCAARPVNEDCDRRIRQGSLSPRNRHPRWKVAILCALLACLPLRAQQAAAIPGPQVAVRHAKTNRSLAFLSRRGIVPRPGQPVPAATLMSARAAHANLLRARAADTSGQPPPAWQPVGPTQVNTSAWNQVTGRVSAIAADPADSSGNTVYIGTTGGGVWKSTNAAGNAAAASFLPLTDDLSAFSTASLASLTVGAVSVQPGGTGVVLAGTGDSDVATDAWYGAGLLRSADGGNTWALIYHTTPGTGGFTYNFIGNAFAGFAWSTSDPNLVVAAVSQSAYGALLGLPNTQSILGLYYSQDAGVTWQMATLVDGALTIQSPQATIAFGNAATSVLWNPVRRRFYAAVRYHGYYESVDGITFTRLQNQPGTNLTTTICPAKQYTIGSPACPMFRGVLAVQPESGDLFALSVDQNNLDQGLWRDACNLINGDCASSTVQFGTQIDDQPLESTTGDGTIPEGDYNLALAAVPSQQDTLLFAGSSDLWRCSLANSCTWRNTTNTQTCASAQVAPAQHAIDATFGGSGLLYFGNDGGLWRSTDAVSQQSPPCSADDAQHFQNLNGGLGSLAEVESFSEDPNNPSTWLAGLGALGTAAPASTPGAWNQVLDGEGNAVAVDPVNPGNWYATSKFGVGINRCTDGTSCNRVGFGAPVIGEAQVDNDVQLIPAPWILDPADTSRVILGTCRVWRDAATGAGWGADSVLSGFLDGESGTFCDGNAEIRSLAAGGGSSSPDGSEEVYAGMAGSADGGGLLPGHLFTASLNDASVAASTVWTDVTASPVINDAFLASRFNPGGFDISSIYADPHDPTGATVYVTVQGVYAPPQTEPVIYRSTDAGAHWVDLTANLPHIPANSVAVDPNDGNTVYVALDTGVYYTRNVAGCGAVDSECWNVYGNGLPNAPVVSLMTYNEGATQALRAATYGRGIWQVNLVTAGITPTAAALAPSSLSFAPQTVQTASAPQAIALTNTGTLNLNVGSVAITGDFSETDTCSAQSIAPQSSCQIWVMFDPSQANGRTGTLTVYANISGGEITASLSGTGLTPGDIILTPSSLVYATTTVAASTAAQSISVANTGESAIALTSETVEGDFVIGANTCGSVLAAQTACEIAIVFTPSASGARTGTLIVTDALGTQSAGLSGTGQTSANDALAPQTLAFAPQQIATTSTTQSVTLTNTGDESLTAIAVSIAGDFSVVNNCGASLQGHASCSILIAYTPTVVGAEPGKLQVTDEFRTQSVALSGSGVAPPGISVTPVSIDFGGLAVGSTSGARAVTLTNSGGFALGNLAVSATPGFIIASDSCPATLAVGSACTVTLTFSPSAAGAVSGTLSMIAANLPRTLNVALSGDGVDFSIVVTGSSSAIVTSGQTATFMLQLTGLSGSAGMAALACSGAPANAGCSMNPTSLAIGAAGTSTATLSIVTGVAPASVRNDGVPGKWEAPILALLLPLSWAGLRRRRTAGLLMLLLAALLLPTGCGVSASSGSGGSGGGGSGGSQYPTPPGAYVITITATMANITHSTAVNLTVQ